MEMNGCIFIEIMTEPEEALLKRPVELANTNTGRRFRASNTKTGVSGLFNRPVSLFCQLISSKLQTDILLGTLGKYEAAVGVESERLQ